MDDVVTSVNKRLTAPENNEDFDAWIELKDAVSFLLDNAKREEFIVGLSANSAFMHAVVVPKSNINPPDVEDLMSWNLDPRSSWGIDVLYSRGTGCSRGLVSISSPINPMFCATCRTSQKL
jgi:hypothetical protein